MYIKRVVIDNIRGFPSLDFTFERPYYGWTVVTGDNGSGKTALLKAIALALVGPDTARSLQPSLRGWVRAGSAKGEIAVEIVPNPDDKFAAGRRYKSSFWSELEFARINNENELKAGKDRRKNKKGPVGGPWKEGQEGWFAAGYGPFRRLFGNSPEAQRIMSGPSRVARFATMFKEDATLGECDLWLKDLNHKALEERKREQAILDQLVRLLNHDFLRNGITVDKVDSDGLWLRDPGNTVLPLSDMSDGYRAALAMLVDIVRHLVGAYEAETFLTDRGRGVSVNHEGVVLIDEVDAHLHPEWQRKIGFWLKEHFPRMQFIVTTHSPLVCQAADVGRIFRLPDPGSNQSPFQVSIEECREIVRSRSDTILLSAAFGMKNTRSEKALASRERYAVLSAKARATQLSAGEKEERKQLELFVDPPEDSVAAEDEDRY